MKTTFPALAAAALLTLTAGHVAGQGPRVEVRWQPDYPVQGRLFRVVVEADAANRLEGIRGEFAGEPLHFVRTGDTEFSALAAAPIDAEGELLLPVVAFWEGGARDSLEMAVPVRRGSYRLEELTVAPRYGAPPDSATLARMRRESSRARAVSRASHDTPRLWNGTVAHPRDTRVTSGFGDGRQFNGRVTSRHMGTDFAGPEGAPVRAAARGVVAL
ncbi:MAG: hypothetical protein R3314_03570, partial [Longimicrobiales bacterium]|nr:hypothetical protein [Longimicrobiales bacterium]